MSKILSAKYYQKHKERLQKKARERFLLKKKKKKCDSMVMNITKISQKLKKITRLSIRKKYYRMTKNALL